MSTTICLLLTMIYTSYAQPWYAVGSYSRYPDTDYTLRVPYPLLHCTKNGERGGASQYELYQCAIDGTGIWGPCRYGADESFRECDDFFAGGFQCTSSNAVGNLINIPSTDGETCDASLTSPPLEQRATTTLNYVETEQYLAATAVPPPDCPYGTGYGRVGRSRITTGVCVEQFDGTTYLMATCTNTSAEIGIYTDNTCTTRTGAEISWSRSCQQYYSTTIGAPNLYFRRVTGCYVNGVDILLNTSSPTTAPTMDPTTIPTSDPTIDPTSVPTPQPSEATNDPTSIPTNVPTDQPSVEPTLEPTLDPSESPTTTASPSLAPTLDLQPDVTLPDAASALAGLDNLSLIYVVFGVLFVFYLFICFYIWFNERRKRRRLTEAFQSGQDKDKRIEYLRKKNQQRRLELQGVDVHNGNGHGDIYNNNAYHQMQAHQQNNVPYNNAMMAEGR